MARVEGHHHKHRRHLFLAGGVGAFGLLISAGFGIGESGIFDTSASSSSNNNKVGLAPSATEIPTWTSTSVPTSTPTEVPTPTPEPTETPVPFIPTRVVPTIVPTRVPEPTQVLPETFASVIQSEAEGIFASLVNSERAKYNLPVLRPNTSLQRAAEGYALFLNNSNWMDYPGESPESLRGKPIPDPHTRSGTPDGRAKAAGYPGIATEVLGTGTVTNPSFLQRPDAWQVIVGDTVNNLLNSPGHRAIILGSVVANRPMTDYGVGCAFGQTWRRPFYSYPVPMLVCIGMFGASSQ